MAPRRTVSDDEILDTARRTWLEDPRASTARIAKRVGLSEATLFKRFRTKIRLMLAAFGVENGPPWVDVVDAGPDDRPVEQQLLAIGTEVEAFFRTMVPRISVLKGIGLSPEEMFGDEEEPPPLVGMRALARWFARAQDHGLIRAGLDPDMLAIAFIGPFQGRAFWRQMFHDRVPIDDEAFVRQTVKVFARGLSDLEVDP